MARVQAGLRERMGSEGLRWEDPGKFHITLRFLGEVAADKLEAVKQAGTAAASACAPFSLGLGCFGAFPKNGPPRVFWIGAKTGLPDYAALAEYLEGRLTACGAAIGAEPGQTTSSVRAHPHITLARAKSPQWSDNIRHILRENNSKKVDKERVFFVYNIVLIESELQSGGSVYTVLNTFQLTAS